MMPKEAPVVPAGGLRLSVNLSSEAAEAIREIAGQRNITVTEAIRRAISTQKYVEDAVRRGARILVEEPNNKVREVSFIV
jgi:hypothetical protein